MVGSSLSSDPGAFHLPGIEWRGSAVGRARPTSRECHAAAALRWEDGSGSAALRSAARPGVIAPPGYKVAPGEVEAVLGQHPAVAEVAVVGAPGASRSQIVVALVSLATRPPGRRRCQQDLATMSVRLCSWSMATVPGVPM